MLGALRGRRDLVTKRGHGPLRRPAVGEQLEDPQRLAGLEVGGHAEASEIFEHLAVNVHLARALEEMVHHRGDAQPGLAGPVYEDRPVVVVREPLGLKRRRECGGGARIVAGVRQNLVGDELRLDDDREVLLDGLDDVLQRRDRAMGEGHQPGRGDLDPPPGRRDPLDLSVQVARSEIEDALVADQRAVAQVERLVLDQQPDDLAVGDVDHRLAVLRVAESGFGVRKRACLVEAAQICARKTVRLALVEVAAHAEVAV